MLYTNIYEHVFSGYYCCKLPSGYEKVVLLLAKPGRSTRQVRQAESFSSSVNHPVQTDGTSVNTRENHSKSIDTSGGSFISSRSWKASCQSPALSQALNAALNDTCGAKGLLGGWMLSQLNYMGKRCANGSGDSHFLFTKSQGPMIFLQKQL